MSWKNKWPGALFLLIPLTGFICWDIARGGGVKPKTNENLTAAKDYRTEEATVEPRSMRSGRVMSSKASEVLQIELPDESNDISSQAEISQEEKDAVRLEQKLARAAKKSETLRAFFLSQPRDGWASQTEIELRQTQPPEGIVFEDVGCRSGVCRIVASGEDKKKVMDAFSTTVRSTKMKSYSRLVSDADGVAKVEGYLSPGDVTWPRPQFDDG